SGLGRFPEAVALGEGVVRRGAASNQPHTLVVALTCLGGLYVSKGDLDHALPLLEQGLWGSDTWSLAAWATHAMAHLGHAYQLAGRFNQALPLLERALERMETTPRATYPLYLAWLSKGYREAGRLAEARERAQWAVDVSRKLKARGVEAYALRSLAAAVSHLDPPNVETAEGYYRQAMARATELRMRSLIAHCHLRLG